MEGSHHLVSHLGLALLLIFGTAMANEVTPPTVVGATPMGAPPIEEPSMVAVGRRAANNHFHCFALEGQFKPQWHHQLC
jgi:hypothetical protein